ncbi:MAG: YggS family pyridoxal phosphate-dependent enzyme [Clostridia bacterium]|nr:YggS family pyridoxal phosphate-dependent enzyme [Clostridia bacterium]
MEKLSAKEFDQNYNAVMEKFNSALESVGKTSNDVILLAATKTVDVDTINYAISKGITHVGENKVQELLSKHNFLNPVNEHFIGHLQTNKVKDVIDKVSLIQSVDSIKLAREISKQAQKRGIVMDILLEVNIGKEESKWGFLPNDIFSAVKEISTFSNLRICGLMTIPPICEDTEAQSKFFREMYNLYVDIREQKIDNTNISILSMGMSDDFDLAIKEGANLVRVGTALFGKRNYL